MISAGELTLLFLYMVTLRLFFYPCIPRNPRFNSDFFRVHSRVKLLSPRKVGSTEDGSSPLAERPYIIYTLLPPQSSVTPAVVFLSVHSA